MTPSLKHGTTAYRKGCRCDVCRTAVAAKDKRRRSRWTDEQRVRKRVRDRAAYTRRADRVLARNREKRYGVSSAQFDALLKAQGGTCAICREPFVRTPHLDHEHSTGAIRGVLCHNCNTALGLFEDSVLRLTDAMQYLLRTRSR